MTNLLPASNLGLAAAPLNQSPLTKIPEDTFQTASDPQQTLCHLTQLESTRHLGPSETPDGTAQLNAALFAGAAPLTNPNVQESLIPLSGLIPFLQQIDTGKLAFVVTVYSLVLMRIGMRDLLLPLLRKGKEMVNGKEPEADEMSDKDPASSWTSWPPPVSSAPPDVLDRQALPFPLEQINHVTSQPAGILYPFIDTPMFWWAIGSSGSQFIRDTSSPLTAYIPEAMALGLALYNKRYRRTIVGRLVRHLNQQNVLLTAPAWRYHVRRPMGIFGPDVIGHYRPEEQYQIGNKYYEGEAKKSLPRGLGAFIELVGFAAQLVQQVRYGMTRRDFNEEMTEFVKNGKIQPADPKFLQIGGVLVRQWVINDADRKRANIIIRNEDRLYDLPVNPKVITYGDHKSTWPDYWPLFMLETMRRRIRMVADSVNYATAWYFRFFPLRLFGFHLVPYALMKLGLPYVDRENSKPKRLSFVKRVIKGVSRPFVRIFLPNPPREKHNWREDVITKMDMGIWPHVFPGATREEMTYHKDGTRDKSGILSTIANPKRPEQILKIGFIDAAMEIAYRDNTSVHLVFIKQDGSDLVAPKVGGGIKTHIQANTLNQDIVATIADITELRLDEETREMMTELRQTKDKARREELSKALKAKQIAILEMLTDKWLSYTGESDLIRTRYAEWVATTHPTEAAALTVRFNDRSQQDRRYLQIAGRIRTIKPKYKTHRQKLEDKLHALVAADQPSDEDIDALNWDVANKKKPKAWYRRIFS